jgi:hypothetical protein
MTTKSSIEDLLRERAGIDAKEITKTVREMINSGKTTEEIEKAVVGILSDYLCSQVLTFVRPHCAMPSD